METKRLNNDRKILKNLGEKVNMTTRSGEVPQKPGRDGSPGKMLRRTLVKQKVQQWTKIVTSGSSPNSWQRGWRRKWTQVVIIEARVIRLW